MNIGSGNGYPSSALSNFAGHAFMLDKVYCASMEGFLQSLKFDKPHIQVEVCKLIGKAAKFRGKKKDWRKTQKLYWKGYEFDRHSEYYQRLLDRAYLEMFRESQSFKNALKASGNAVFTHTIGKSNPKETVLTQSEFCSRLTYLRSLL